MTRSAFFKPTLAGVNYLAVLNFLIIFQHLSEASGSRANPEGWETFPCVLLGPRESGRAAGKMWVMEWPLSLQQHLWASQQFYWVLPFKDWTKSCLCSCVRIPSLPRRRNCCFADGMAPCQHWCDEVTPGPCCRGDLGPREVGKNPALLFLG